MVMSSVRVFMCMCVCVKKSALHAVAEALVTELLAFLKGQFFKFEVLNNFTVSRDLDLFI